MWWSFPRRVGKFKSSSDNFTTRQKPLDPHELLDLLRSGPAHSYFDSHRQSVITNRVLNQLLDRQDLYDLWLSNMDGVEKGEKEGKMKKINNKTEKIEIYLK